MLPHNQPQSRRRQPPDESPSKGSTMVSQPAPEQGAPVEAYASRDFVIVNMRAVRELGSWEAAGCFQRIAWRAERDGYWTATMQEIADEIGVSIRTAKRITQTLRDKGWVEAERKDSQVATLTWTVVWRTESANVALSDSERESANLAPGSEGQTGTDVSANVAPTVGANVALSSTKTVETPETNSDAPPAASPKRGTRLPDDWEPDEDMREWFRQQPFANAVNPVAETQKFVDYWKAQPGQRGVKLDWVATWRNWMRTAAERRAGGSRAPQHPPVSDDHRQRVSGLF